MFAFVGQEPNFGDELNHWLWPKVLPDFFDEDDSVRFIGIGSTIYDFHPAQSRKVVFGAGYAGYSGLPTLDDTWDIRFVRGRNTASILGLDPDLAVGDAAILLRTLNLPPVEKRYETSYIPHFQSANDGSWEAVCRLAGVHFIDPRWPVDKVLDHILASKLIVSEAMHGVIVSDALRVPWRAIEPLNPDHHAKWQDWSSVLDVEVKFTALGPSNPIEWLMSRFWKKKRLVYALRNRRGWLGKLGGGLPSPFAASRLRALKGTQGQLSPDAAIRRATERMQEEVVRLRESYG